MKILFVYSEHDTEQLTLIERIKTEMSTYVEEIVAMEVEEAKQQFHIRATPAIIPICDHWQGEGLLAEGVNGQLLITATTCKLSEEEDLAIHQAETFRLDNFVKAEINTKLKVNAIQLDMAVGTLLETQTSEQIDAIIKVLEIIANI